MHDPNGTAGDVRAVVRHGVVTHTGGSSAGDRVANQALTAGGHGRNEHCHLSANALHFDLVSVNKILKDISTGRSVGQKHFTAIVDVDSGNHRHGIGTVICLAGIDIVFMNRHALHTVAAVLLIDLSQGGILGEGSLFSCSLHLRRR